MRPVRVLFFLTVLIFSQSAFAQLKLTDTEAGKAFKSGDYDKALTELKVLLEEYPNDAVTILRYIGISYHRLGEYKKVLASFEQALEIDRRMCRPFSTWPRRILRSPIQPPRVKYSERIIILAPDSLYAEWSERYVQAIIQRETEYKQPGGPKLYDVFIQVAPQLDFNVPEDPNVGSTFSDDESFRFTEYASLGLRTKQLGNWMLGTYFRPTRASTRKGACGNLTSRRSTSRPTSTIRRRYSGNPSRRC
ncbi:MAG: tetratricopeptide repeat protein [Thermodesulfobacteriota bacterium]